MGNPDRPQRVDQSVRSHYHPDHDNRDSKGNVLAAGGESHSIDRACQFTFTESPPEGSYISGWGSTVPGGIYQESIVGLHRRTQPVRGSFGMRRVSEVVGRDILELRKLMRPRYFANAVAVLLGTAAFLLWPGPRTPLVRKRATTNAIADGMGLTTTADPFHVFHKAFWRRPASNEEILHVEPPP